MDLNDIFAMAEEQSRGRDLEILHPTTGEPTGIVFRIAGPDSEVQANARLAYRDELDDAADRNGRVTSKVLETARVNQLARCVVGWTITQDGKSLPFSHENVVRVLTAAHWMQLQVDDFAGNRASYFAAERAKAFLAGLPEVELEQGQQAEGE